MNEIILKLNTVCDLIVSEKRLGTLILFALIKRTDLEDKWDILICASKLEKNNSEADLTYVIGKLKDSFGDDLSFLSQIVLLVKNEDIIIDIARALNGINIKLGEVPELKLIDNYKIGINVIKSDFSTLDLSPSEKTIEKANVGGTF